MTTSIRRFCRARVVVAVLTAIVAVLGWGQVASAHTDFESSVPGDGATVDGPLAEVVVNFTNPAQPAGAGFELLDPTGSVRAPTSIDATDGTSFVLSFDPPLDAGVFGLSWSVQAGDAHPIEGSFRFEVRAAPGATTTTLPAAPTTTAAVVVEPPASPPTDGATGAGETSLDEFLDTGSTADDSVAVGRAGRTLSMLGTIFGVGVLAALVWTVRGDRDELVSQLTWVRLAGLVVFTGGLLEYAALAESGSSASLTAVLSTRPGLAAALKMVGGLAVMVGFHPRAGRIVAPTQPVSAAVAGDLAAASPAQGTGSGRSPGEQRWSPTPTVALGALGYALVLASYWFDGHTVSKGPWVVHALVNFAHLGAGAVWGGGVFAMTTIVWMRRRRSERLGVAEMVVRFSSIATVSLAAVIVAGLVMAWMILDAPADLFGTDWGRVLVAKTALVAVAVGLGAFNHFRLRPALERRPDDPHLASELRVTLSAESAVFVAIVVLTAILVASAT